jgi:uncharacterized membrane protein
MWRPVLSALALVAYALLAHWLMLHAAGAPWAIAVLMGPLLLMLAGFALARRNWALLALTGAGALGVAWSVAHGGVGEVNRLYVLQQAAINLVLGGMFAATLRPGRVPLITAVALRVHGGRMVPAQYPYTRHVTEAWAAYFFGVVVVSLLLYAFASWAVWSLFANVGTPLLAAALMFGEWRLRYWLHPEFERVPISAAMRAFRQPASSVAQR